MSTRVTVIVKANASENQVVKVDEDTYKVSTTATPEKGKANEAVIKLLAGYLGLPSSHLVIKLGKTAKRKTVEITPTAS